jgi:chemotaxis receptor (MCP) glutamine deamidase CheD
MRANALPKIKMTNPLEQALDKPYDSTRTSHHFLHAGQLHISADGQPIVLILGSCVAVCIWDSVSGIGGATHYLLPVWDGKGKA